MSAILGFLIGAVLGTRYRVFSLVPVAIGCIGAVGIHAAAARVQLGAALLAMLGITVALQIGYLFGLAVRVTMVGARVRTAAEEPVQQRPALPI
ncbi:hypothetical protein BJ123_10938 [Rhodopseudomonas thermotolerans]|uniref:Uncharacterized protein n=2 Tax=Rhodopseudomonas TaxID=1073 RepID=A0A336JTE4_9BRAD|nr:MULTISPECIES: hypothetical protein [Rhodopseudomonas]RED35194.1 hypothetical protein BJ125_10938 [Rhodopseudomonas pentothenatexigens]REG03037.1 hypothetical protein BJ123_10938 [Rhodopseudomonas thermotolerans]SSW90884.1 hypothetical protein SAMN05892882_10938 [Rhodopseudomonas pentothenatexigens]